ncbi:MAG TPA: 4'-phosphopantetheinyl transferase superfamily protein [Geodermatophilus sp.]|nr:4'-phosphopantetheinyl transferase superfamily protein [Geodermatophilus sp.]
MSTPPAPPAGCERRTEARRGRPATGLIAHVLPPGVASAEAFGDPPHPPLPAAEAALVARAAPPRREEFATGRTLARRALADLGLPAAVVLRDEQGAPAWPAGVVGSITHCPGYRAVAVARVGTVPALGVDAEPASPLPDGVLEMISLPDERALMRRLADARPGVCWERVLFCAKEAVYKAWFPLARRWLDFEDARVEVDPSGTFTAGLLVPGPRVDDVPLTAFTGRWLSRDGLVVAAVSGRRCDATRRAAPGR